MSLRGPSDSVKQETVYDGICFLVIAVVTLTAFASPPFLRHFRCATVDNALAVIARDDRN